MYAIGHYGVSLLVYAPVGWALLAWGAPLAALLGGGIVVGLATFPDVDLRVAFVPHRGPTHSLAFAAVVGAALAGVGGALGAGPAAVAFLGAMGALGVLAHLAGDVLTPAGVNLLWPLPGPTVSLSVVRASNTAANWGLFALGMVVTTGLVVAAGG